MIRKVHFQNFRCLRDVELTLEPLTVLVGPNSSGKTTVLEGLRVYSPELQSLAFEPGSLRRENTLAFAQRLTGSGSNLTNVFASLTRQQQGAVARELCRLVPMFSDVDLETTAQGQNRLRFRDRWASDLWFSPDEVSDGTILMLAFIVLQHQPLQAEIITIEEPERVIHPYLFDDLVQGLRKMTTGDSGGKSVQVVLTTRSAELLDHVHPTEVRLLTRSQEDGSVKIEQVPSGTTHWRRVYEEYDESLGGIWLSGGMGGVPRA